MVRKTSLVLWWKVYWVGKLIMECFPTGIFSDWKLFWLETLPLASFATGKISDWRLYHWKLFQNLTGCQISTLETFSLLTFPTGKHSCWNVFHRNNFLQECFPAGMFTGWNVFLQEWLLTGNSSHWNNYRWQLFCRKLYWLESLPLEILPCTDLRIICPLENHPSKIIPPPHRKMHQ